MRRKQHLSLKVFLFPDNFYQNTLSSFSVELTVKYLFPRTEIKLTVSNSNYYFAPHNRTLQMSVGIILSCVVVTVL